MLRGVERRLPQEVQDGRAGETIIAAKRQLALHGLIKTPGRGRPKAKRRFVKKDSAMPSGKYAMTLNLTSLYQHAMPEASLGCKEWIPWPCLPHVPLPWFQCVTAKDAQVYLLAQCSRLTPEVFVRSSYDAGDCVFLRPLTTYSIILPPNPTTLPLFWGSAPGLKKIKREKAMKTIQTLQAAHGK